MHHDTQGPLAPIQIKRGTHVQDGVEMHARNAAVVAIGDSRVVRHSAVIEAGTLTAGLLSPSLPHIDSHVDLNSSNAPPLKYIRKNIYAVFHIWFRLARISTASE